MIESIKRAFLRYYQFVFVILCFFALWQAIVVLFHIPEFILPTPVSAIDHLIFKQPDANYNWGLQIYTTGVEIAASFCVTAFVGLLIAVIMSWSRFARELLLPVFVFLNSLPVIAIAPIILIWTGYGLFTNIIIAFLVSFFPIVINTVTGLEAVDDDLLDLVGYLGASKLQIFLKIRIPNALPYIFSGLKISSTMCIVGVVVGEFLASDRGLGYIIINSQSMMDIPPVFSSLVVISILGAMLYCIVALLERFFMPWRRAKAEQ